MLATLAPAASDPGSVLPVPADLAQPEAFDRIVAAALERFGRVDVLVNNAGIGQASVRADQRRNPIRFWEATPEQWSRFLSVNATAPIMPKKLIDGVAAGKLPQTSVVGTGPYRLAEWVPDKHVHLERFAQYSPVSVEASGYAGRRLACIDHIYFVPVPEVSSRVAGLESGDYDYAQNLPAETYKRLTATKGLKTVILKPYYEIVMMRGWGDVEFVATDHRVPTIYFGPGTVAAAHTADEYIDLDRYHMGVAVYERAIPEFLGTA